METNSNDYLELEPKHKSFNHWFWVGVIAIALIAAGLIYTLNKNSGLDESEEPNQGEELKGWQSFKHGKYNYVFEYPADEYLLNPSDDFTGDEDRIVLVSKVDDSRIIVEYFDEGFSLSKIRQNFAPTGFEDIDPEAKKIGANTFYYYGAGGGGVEYPDKYFYDVNGKILAIAFDGPYENSKTPTDEMKMFETEFLATFEFSN